MLVDLVCRGHWGQSVRLEVQEQWDRLALQEFREDQVRQAHQELKDPTDLPDQQDSLVQLDPPVILVLQDPSEILVHQEVLEQQDSPELLVSQEVTEQLELLERADLAALRATRDHKDLRVL